jgi:hypothetical protein
MAQTQGYWISWVPQNTGWSGGISWFDTKSGPISRYKATVCASKEEAQRVNAELKEAMKTSEVLYRVVKRTVTEEYFYD